MEISIETVEILLLIAAIVAMLARRLKIPYTVGLVLAGIGLAFFPFAPNITITKDLIFTFFLPPLIYEAALYIRWKELRRDFLVITAYATLGVILSAALTAVGMRFFANWQWQSAALFGALIAATDPVSVIASFKEAGVHGRLRLLVEAEPQAESTQAYLAVLSHVMLHAPSFSLRGGTREILRGIIARGLGLR